MVDEDGTGVLFVFTQILKRALCLLSSCPDSALLHGLLCSLAEFSGVAVEAGNGCERQVAARLTRWGRNR